ncbi:MAG: GYD domain-containing protein [Thaumarchaeota archaeon]|nr:GYD domain-containing protein [Nitrososphaerota archaeon]
MWFVSLVKFRKKPTKETVQWADQMFKKAEAWGVKTHMALWTLGRYDAVRIGEAPDVATAMKTAIAFADLAAVETLVAVSRDEAIKLLE